MTTKLYYALSHLRFHLAQLFAVDAPVPAVPAETIVTIPGASVENSNSKPTSLIEKEPTHPSDFVIYKHLNEDNSSDSSTDSDSTDSETEPDTRPAPPSPLPILGGRFTLADISFYLTTFSFALITTVYASKTILKLLRILLWSILRLPPINLGHLILWLKIDSLNVTLHLAILSAILSLLPTRFWPQIRLVINGISVGYREATLASVLGPLLAVCFGYFLEISLCTIFKDAPFFRSVENLEGYCLIGARGPGGVELKLDWIRFGYLFAIYSVGIMIVAEMVKKMVEWVKQ